MKIKKISLILGGTIIAGLVFYSLVLITGFILVKYNLSDTKGQVDEQSSRFQANEDLLDAITAAQNIEDLFNRNSLPRANDSQATINRKINLCRLRIISALSPENTRKILHIDKRYNDERLLNKMIFAINLKLAQDASYQEKISQCAKEHELELLSIDDLLKELGNATSTNLFSWLNYEEWTNMRAALIKDKDVIISASKAADIEPRLLVSIAIVEQLRMYYTQRALYKQFFAPLKMLGNATKFSLGIMNIKEKTAIETENHLKDQNSVYYPGPLFENLLDFKATSTTKERYTRLTDEKNHYYSYLYGALYIKQLLAQWQRSGFNINKRPEIVSTLFNIGFKNSQPKSHPEVGGAEIEIGGVKYSFGSLSYEFYYSGEMVDFFGYDAIDKLD